MAESLEAHKRRRGVIEVDTGTLVVATSNKASLVRLENTVQEFAAEQPSRGVRALRRYVA